MVSRFLKQPIVWIILALIIVAVVIAIWPKRQEVGSVENTIVGRDSAASLATQAPAVVAAETNARLQVSNR